MSTHLSPVLSPLDEEIYTALSLFFSNPNSFSSVYWPRTLRNLLVVLCQHLLSHKEVLEQFQQEEESVQELLEEVKKPQSHNIGVPHRKVARKLLLRVLFRDASLRFFIPAMKLHLQNTIWEVYGKTAWPTDLFDAQDLKESLRSWTLRQDVLQYLMELGEKALQERPFRIQFIEARQDAMFKQFPIKIEVGDDEDVQIVQRMIQSESRSIDGDGLLPEDLVEVISFPNIAKYVSVSGECLCTSRSWWGKETRGGECIILPDTYPLFDDELININHIDAKGYSDL